MTDTPKDIPPALTPEEWTDLELSNRGKTSPPLGCYIDPDDGGVVINGAWVDPDERAGVAALCLYGQPFGFTQEHVDALSTMLDAGERWCNHINHPREWWVILEKARAARLLIAALLPRGTP